MKFVSATILALACIASAAPIVFETQKNGCRMYTTVGDCNETCGKGSICEQAPTEKLWCCSNDYCDCTY
ncbi:hypothetical protein F4806DRAFT_489910 [Annulohypoxylon nitens]|nr:hypothetical protein F4806DRAFT_489910 [Annulohypoxylon nitens]